MATTFIASQPFYQWANSDAFPDFDYTMPALFIGHGAPLYTLDENPYSLAWKKLGAQLPKPKAILCVSAHWLTPGRTKVSAVQQPKTIHDFGNIHPDLFNIAYPAPGSPALAQLIHENKPMGHHIELDHKWGYDHGAWTVARWLYPKADVPMLQMSIDYSAPADHHFALGQALASLRKKGILVLASGNIVHNLRKIRMQENFGYDWAKEFDQTSKALIEKRDFQALVAYAKLGKAAELSIPTPDHYYPLLYVLGMIQEDDPISFPIEGLSYGSTSMRSVLVGNTF